jgi:hypothetical protein
MYPSFLFISLDVVSLISINLDNVIVSIFSEHPKNMYFKCETELSCIYLAVTFVKFLVLNHSFRGSLPNVTTKVLGK